jgi:outer membrane immunogenic protein
MKKFLVAVIAAAALYGAPALAADVAVKAPGAAPFNWTGFYVGGEAGYAWGHTSHFIGNTNSTGDFGTAGLAGGATVGYNLPVGPNWLAGIETDVSLSGIEGNGFGGNFGCVQLASPGGCHTSVDWFGTVRGRAGFIYGNALFYGTGGWAYGKAEADILGCSTGTAGFCGRKDVSGWTAGGGIEYALDRNWSAKLEYLYVNMGNFVYAPSPQPGCGAGCSSSAKFDLVRIGLNYKFGSQ